MRTKPILKLIKSVRFHVKEADQFKIADDIRHVIEVTRHFKAVSTKMTKYPDMDISKKLINYTDDLQSLMQKYPNYPEFNSRDQKRFIKDLLKVYYFIYFDSQNKCQVEAINTTVKVAKTAGFKKRWQQIENKIKDKGNLVLDARFVSSVSPQSDQNGTLIIKYLSKGKINQVFK